jgi:soluble lytic murein transglycosylase-like protein
MHTGKAEIAARVGFLLFLSAVSARAEVIEVELDGTTITHTGPSLLSSRSGEIEHVQSPQVKPPPPALHAAASRHDIADALVAAVAWQESHWRQAAISPKGARGLMQLMPATAKTLGVNAGDPDGNAEGGAAYLRQLLQRFDGDITLALAAYNAGPAAVIRYGGVPPYPETQKYVAAVLDRLADISLTQSPSGAPQ